MLLALFKTTIASQTNYGLPKTKKLFYMY